MNGRAGFETLAVSAVAAAAMQKQQTLVLMWCLLSRHSALTQGLEAVGGITNSHHDSSNNDSAGSGGDDKGTAPMLCQNGILGTNALATLQLLRCCAP